PRAERADACVKARRERVGRGGAARREDADPPVDVANEVNVRSELAVLRRPGDRGRERVIEARGAHRPSSCAMALRFLAIATRAVTTASDTVPSVAYRCSARQLRKTSGGAPRAVRRRASHSPVVRLFAFAANPSQSASMCGRLPVAGSAGKSPFASAL